MIELILDHDNINEISEKVKVRVSISFCQGDGENPWE